MKRLLVYLGCWIVLPIHFSEAALARQSSVRPSFEYFLGHLVKGDFDSNPDLDFIMVTRQKPGQDFALDDIRRQPFQIIAVHRGFVEKTTILETIRREINEILCRNRFNQILVFGRFKSFTGPFFGIFDGCLELTQIEIFDQNGAKKIFLIEGVVGGIKSQKKASPIHTSKSAPDRERRPSLSDSSPLGMQ